MPIVVIGGGPVGLLTAINLTQHGLRPILIEADEELSWDSRAICISRRSMEIFDRAGAGAAIGAKALGWTSGRTFYRNELVFQLTMSSSEGFKHTPFVNLQQYYTEQFLLDALTATGLADIRWGTRVVALDQREDRVRLSLGAGDRRETIDAAWVVAADGGRSACRELLGLRLNGTSYEGRYLIADIEIGASRPVERQVWFDAPSNPGSTVILHVQPDNYWRLDFQLLDGENAEQALEDVNLMRRIGDHLAGIGETAPWRLHWKSLYRANCLTLDEYRHGRVLFAGDAAHLVPIFGVRGLNSGIDDAHNLAWKLALVAGGLADPVLLDSYTQERVAAARENIAQGTKSTWFMSPPSAGFALMRDAVLSLSARHLALRPLINPRQAAPHDYANSPLTTWDDDPGGVPPGVPLPNFPVALRDERRGFLHDFLALRAFTVLAYAPALSTAQREALGSWAQSAPVPVTVLEYGAPECIIPIDPDLAGHLGADRWPIILVRPDEHVTGRLAAFGVAQLQSVLACAACCNSTRIEAVA